MSKHDEYDSDPSLEEEEEEEDVDISDPSAREKNKLAAGYANTVLKELIAACAPGKLVLDLCKQGDERIIELTSTVYRKGAGEKKVQKGVAFPTSINVNKIVCHYAPAEDSTVLAVGDVVRIDLGVHIDGHCAVVAHTLIVQAQGENTPLTGPIADLFAASQMCMEAAVHSLRPGGKNNDITAMWEKIAEAYGVHLCEGVLSHRMKRFVIDGNETIISKATSENKVEEYEFEEHEVWAVDVVLSNNATKLREDDARPVIYKRNPDQMYNLKLKASRDTIKEINERFQLFPFTTRSLDAKTGRLGVAECLRHDLVMAYPVLCCRQGDIVVHFKSTVFVTDKSTEKVTGVNAQKYTTEKKLQDAEIKKVIATPLKYASKAAETKKA